MTVDEMEDAILYSDLGDGTQAAIIAALRAGQELSTLVLQGAIIGARGERDLFAAAYKFKNAATKGESE